MSEATLDSQCDHILAWLKRGRAITPLDALQQFGCLRLGARIWDLRRAGHHIDRTMLELPSGKRVARYVLTNAA